MVDKTHFKLSVTETLISNLRLTQFLLSLVFNVFTPISQLNLTVSLGGEVPSSIFGQSQQRPNIQEDHLKLWVPKGVVFFFI